LTSMAVAGMGVAYVPDFVAAPALQAGVLCRCLPEYHSRPTPVMLAYRYSSDRVRRVRVVLDLAMTHIPKLLIPSADFEGNTAG
ncbi:MAG: LysR substrate-binding domain-containing protein, partial [Myxococcota bacterium]